MKFNEMIEISRLYDAYGKLLKVKQQEIMNLYLFKNLQIIEIAQLKQVSKQAIFKIIDACSKRLEEIESELGFCKKLERIKNLGENLLVDWQDLNETFKDNKNYLNAQIKLEKFERILKQLQEEL